MLEKCHAKIRSGTLATAWFRLKPLAVLPRGGWISLVVLAMVAGRWGWLHASRPAHRQEITNAYGSVSLFYEAPRLNHDASRFIYSATSDRGFGLFLYDIINRKIYLICEDDFWGPLGHTRKSRVWAWAPDDSAFVYTLSGKFVISPSDPERFSQAASFDMDPVSDVAWLSPSQVVCKAVGTICCFQRQPGGNWSRRDWPCPDGLSCLASGSSHRVVWYQNGFVCQTALDMDTPGTNNPFIPTFRALPAPPPTNGLVLWLDASRLRQPDHSAVSSLMDLSPSKNDTSPNVNAPSYNAPGNPAALNGYGTIHFSSGDSIKRATGLKTRAVLGLTGSKPRSVFAVMRYAERKRMLLGTGTPSIKNGCFDIGEENGSVVLPANRPVSAGLAYANKYPLAPNNWNLLGVVFDGVRSRSYINRGLQGAGSFHANTADKEVEIGLRVGSEPAASDGDFAEMLVYDRPLDFSEQRQVEDYLEAKWLGINPMSATDPLVWFDTRMDGVTNLSVSAQSGQVMLTQALYGQTAVWRFAPSKDAEAEPKLMAKSATLREAQWTSDGNSTYLESMGTHERLMLADSQSDQKTALLEKAAIASVSAPPAGGKLVIFGTFSNEPSTGIWQYDLNTKQLCRILSCSDHPSPYAGNIASSFGAIRLPSGRVVNCTIWMPVNFDRHKKYPVVIGDTVLSHTINGDHGRLWVPDLAACGALVVHIDRADWWGGIGQWEENIRGIHHVLAQEPCIDLHRVYLFAVSAETRYANECITRTPGLWRGVIMPSPGELPDFSHAPPFQSRPEILLSAGELGAGEHIKQYQAEALKSGVLVEYVIHPGEGHRIIGNAAQLERTRAIMHFIFEE